MPIRWNPSRKQVSEGLLLGLDFEGEFTSFDRLDLDVTAGPVNHFDIQPTLNLIATANQVLLQAYLYEYFHFEGKSPGDGFTTRTPTLCRTYLRYDTINDGSLGSFGIVESIITDSSKQTLELRRWLSRTDDEELEQFGISALRRIL